MAIDQGGRPERLLLISADCHAGTPEGGYKPYLERKHWEAYDAYLNAGGAHFSDLFEEITGGLTLEAGYREEWNQQERVVDGKSGVYLPERRIQELERDGCVGEVIFPDHQNFNEPPFGVFEGVGAGGFSPEQQQAGAQAYNRWLAEMCARHPDRMAGIAMVAVDDIDAAVKEVEWARNAGLRGGILLSLIHESLTKLPNYHAPRYEPLWAVCEELDMPVHTHGAGGAPSFGRYPGSARVWTTETQWYAHRPFWMLMWAGVFERHPRLKFVLTEQGASWIPGSLVQLDALHANKKFVSQSGETLRLKPSEYWARQCWVGATGAASTRADFELRHAIGVDKMMWGSDYPHPEGTWPHTGEQLRETFSGVPEEQLRPLLGENAAQVYNFDVARLRPVVQRVGPAVGELAAA